MYVHIFRADGRNESKYVNVQPHLPLLSHSCETAREVAQKCNLQNKDKAAFCIVGPCYDVASPSFNIFSYALAVKGNALYLSEYDYLDPMTFPHSVADMSVIGNVC